MPEDTQGKPGLLTDEMVHHAALALHRAGGHRDWPGGRDGVCMRCPIEARLVLEGGLRYHSTEGRADLEVRAARVIDVARAEQRDQPEQLAEAIVSEFFGEAPSE